MRTLYSDKRIGILFSIHNLGPGGAERHLLNVLKNLERSLFRPYVCCLDKYGEFVPPIEKMGIEVSDLSVKSLYSPHAVRGLIKLVYYLRNNRIQIVHNLLFKSIVIGTLAARIAGVAVIINSRRDMGWALNSRQRFLLNLTNRCTDKIIAVCEAVKKRSLEVENISEEKIAVIYNGIDTNDFSPQPSLKTNALRSKFKIPANSRVVGTITHLTKVKGNEYLVRAAPLVLKRFPHTRFLIVGDGDQKHALSSLAVKIGVKDRLIFTGQRNDITDILGLMHIYVCPSFSEGMSNSILEAMAMGKPVIATDVGGNRELVENGRNGLLVRPKNEFALARSMIELISQPERMAKMGIESRRMTIRKFQPSTMIDQLMQLYLSHLTIKTDLKLLAND